MRKIRFALQLAVVLTLSFAASAVTPAWAQLAQLTASDGQMFDGLGNSVSISGDTVVAGAPKADAAYVFVKPQSGWTNMTQVAKLTASDGQPPDFFGGTVAISGDTIVVGSQCATVNGNLCAGAAYVFVKPVSGWADMTETAKLTTSDGQPDDYASQGLSIDGNTIALGAPNKSIKGVTSEGEVYVYQRPASGWATRTETVNFKGSGHNRFNQGDSFGESVALGGDGGTLVVGVPNVQVALHNFGILLVFLKSSSGWRYTTSFTTQLLSSKDSVHELGDAVAISGDGGTVVGGAPDFGPKPGKALIFVKPATGWPARQMTETATLTDGTGSADFFGRAVGMSGDRIIAAEATGTNLGAAYVFAKPANGWKTTHKYQAMLMASGETSNWGFGASVSISGTASVVGADGWNAQGAAFVFGK